MNIFYYKIICLFVGLSIIIMGYNLFIKGLFNDTGEISGQWKDFNLTMKKAAPGVYFVLFGSAIIIFTIIQGFSEETLDIKKPYHTQDEIKTELPDSMKIK